MAEVHQAIFGALAASLVSIAVGGVVSPLVLEGLRRMKSRQTIQKELEEHMAKQGTPTMGGLIVLVGVLAGLIAIRPESWLIAILILLGFGVVGFMDDYLVPKLKPGSRGFDWKPKLALQFLIGGLALWMSGVHDAAGIGLGLFTILFFSNAYNFSDGLDGLSGGLGMILCAGLIGLILMKGVGAFLPLVVILAALGAAFIPFLFHNAPPAKVFMGDVGSLPFGALMGWIAFLLLRSEDGGWDFSSFVPLLVISFVMFAEIIPPPLQVASAKLRKGKRLFPFKTPIHHGFQGAGMPETRIVPMFHLVQAACVLCGWLIQAWSLGWANP